MGSNWVSDLKLFCKNIQFKFLGFFNGIQVTLFQNLCILHYNHVIFLQARMWQPSYMHSFWRNCWAPHFVCLTNTFNTCTTLYTTLCMFTAVFNDAGFREINVSVIWNCRVPAQEQQEEDYHQASLSCCWCVDDCISISENTRHFLLLICHMCIILE